MTDATTKIQDLKNSIKKFVEERDWQQFHTPKNLSMSIAVEAAELMELFNWIESNQSTQALEKKREQVEQEVADIAANLLSLCAHYDIDLAQAFERKKKINQEKYPVEKSKGIATKYTDL